MNQNHTPAQALSLIDTILSEMGSLGKPQFKFMSWLFTAWLGLPVRHTMLNLARFGPYCDKTIRLYFARSFCFADFGRHLIEHRCGPERIAAFDPTHLSKAGRHTYGVDTWWCGSRQQMARGLELGVLGVIDVAARSALALQATQTPSRQALQAQGQTLLEHYVSILKGQHQRLRQLGITYVTADAYFAKKPVLDALIKRQLHLVTRLRQDANLRYLYHGPRHHHGRAKSGRPRLYDGKVDCANIDKRRLRLFAQDQHCRYYSGVVYAVAFKRLVRVVFIQSRQDNQYRILMSTDTALAPEKIVEYYKLRFQIEFLIRDTKQYAGLEACQARAQEKLDFHFNLALSAVSVAKAAFWLPLPADQRGAFSMRNIQLLFTNRLFTDRVFRNLGLDMRLQKYQMAYNQCLNMDRLAV